MARPGQHLLPRQGVRAGPSLDAEPDEALGVTGLTVRLGGREVLRDVSFTIRRGEFVGLIGSNGAGKTTLMRAILGLLQPAAGEIRIVGRPRRGKARAGTAIGYVPQKIQFDPDIPLRARDLVALGLDGHRLGFPLPSRSRRGLVDDMLRAVDAEHIADARVGLLSGGEQQRIMIAHALVSRPGLLLLDEPLANLDIANEQEVVGLLARIAREQQIAVLISAHEMNPLLPVMDRIVYMAAGRAASGPTDEVVRDEVLTELYGRHVDVIRLHGRVLVVAGPELPAEAASGRVPAEDAERSRAPVAGAG